jgi:hypothetical protein
MMIYPASRGLRWRGESILEFGDGINAPPGAPVTKFMFPGDPTTASFWSELNSDGNGHPLPPTDRRFVAGSGPFSMEQGDEQEIILAMVWGRGRDHLDSITELRKVDRFAQAIADVNFDFPPRIDAPILSATPYAGAVSLTWSNPPASNNFVDRFNKQYPTYEAAYRFEGYNVYQYSSEDDSIGLRIATYDVDNSVTEVEERRWAGDGSLVPVAWGTDAGVRHHHTVANVNNYTTYCFGVEAYAYQSALQPLVIRSPMSRVCLEPRRPGSIVDAPPRSLLGVESIHASPVSSMSTGEVRAGIVDPAKVTGRVYDVRISPSTCEVSEAGAVCVALEIVLDDEVVVIGGPPVTVVAGESLFVADGLEWSIVFDGSGPESDETYVLDTAPFAPVALTLEQQIDALDAIGIVPNPYYAYSAYEVSREREVRLTNVPPGSTINIFTLNGSKIRTLESDANSPGAILSWDLQNEAGRLVGNGAFLIHVNVPGVGTRVFKFSVIRGKLAN